MATFLRAVGVAPLLWALACVPQNAGYEDVRSVVARTGHDARWRHIDAGNSRKEVRALVAAPLTSDSAVKLALLNNADLQATFEELGIARADLVRALRLPNPTAEGGLRYADGESPSMDVAVSQDLSELILLPLRSNAAEAEFAAAKLEVAGRVMDLILDVRKAFYDYLADQQILAGDDRDVRRRRASGGPKSKCGGTDRRAHHERSGLRLTGSSSWCPDRSRTGRWPSSARSSTSTTGRSAALELRRTVLEALKASALAAEEIHRAGNLNDLDLASQQVLYEEARVSLSSAETTLATSRERLNALLGVSGTDTTWQATGRLPDPDEAPPEGAEGTVVGRSVELAAIRQRFSAASERAKLARTRGFLPELKAGVAFEREDGGWSTGPIAEIELPIFYQGQGEVARAQAEMRREQHRLGATAVRLRAALRAVHVRASTARQRALYYKDVLLPMRERIVSDTQLQFNAMNTSVFQLLIARRDQIETGRAYIDALREYWMAKADLEQLFAGRLPPSAMMAAASAPGAGAAAGAPGDAH